MTTQTGVTLYFVGRDKDDAVKFSEAFTYEKHAQEAALDNEDVYMVHVPVSSPWLEKVKKWK